MWIFQYKFSSIFIARYLRYFICLLFISNIFLKFWVIHLSYWNEKQSIYIRNKYSQRKYQKKLFSKGSSTCTNAQRGTQGGEGSSQMHTFAYRGEGDSRLGTYTWKYFGPKNLKTFLFFVQKKLLHCHLLLCIEKCKLALNYKQKSFRCWFSEI